MSKLCKNHDDIYKNVCKGSDPNKKKVLALLPHTYDGATYKMQNFSENSGNFSKIYSGHIDE